jgi:hypothetical protein
MLAGESVGMLSVRAIELAAEGEHPCNVPLVALPKRFVAAPDGTLLFYFRPELQDVAFATLVLSHAQTDGRCTGRDGTPDPADPNCAKLVFAGELSSIVDSARAAEARASLAARFPAMRDWPVADFHVVSLNVSHVVMTHGHGGDFELSMGRLVTPQPGETERNAPRAADVATTAVAAAAQASASDAVTVACRLLDNLEWGVMSTNKPAQECAGPAWGETYAFAHVNGTLFNFDSSLAPTRRHLASDGDNSTVSICMG